MRVGRQQGALEAATDRAHLSRNSYADSGKLRARASIYKYRRPALDIVPWALAQVPWSGDETVLDVGCGAGGYLRGLGKSGQMRLVGMDLSTGMLREVRDSWDSARRPLLAACDAQSIPLRPASCDRILAMHMLYHVPDIGMTLKGLRDLLVSDGLLMAGTNGEAHLAELRDLFHEAHEEAEGRSLKAVPHWSRRFRLERGCELASATFGHVEVREHSGNIVVPDAQPVIDYLESTRSVMEKALSAGVDWKDVMSIAARRIGEIIEAEGAFRARTIAGVILCRP